MIGYVLQFVTTLARLYLRSLVRNFMFAIIIYLGAIDKNAQEKATTINYIFLIIGKR